MFFLGRLPKPKLPQKNDSKVYDMRNSSQRGKNEFQSIVQISVFYPKVKTSLKLENLRPTLSNDIPFFFKLKSNRDNLMSLLQETFADQGRCGNLSSRLGSISVPSYHLLASSHWPKDASFFIPIGPREVNMDQWEQSELCELKCTPRTKLKWSNSPKTLFVHAEGCGVHTCQVLATQPESTLDQQYATQIPKSFKQQKNE